MSASALLSTGSDKIDPAQQSFAVRAELVLGVATVAVVGVMILPMPAFLLDLLLSMSVSLSLVIFLFSLHIEKPLEFSAFPSILLLTTLLRLALNVASTRLILLHGNEGLDAAGHVIAAFGEFVVGGNAVVGIIIFLILVVINFVVITKGSGRIAEVAARFTLDSMPGKQMAIDADLSTGLCTEEDARIRRRSLEQEADFFGSMDGAAKFVRGDAVAGLLITAVNIIGGLIIGILQQHMDISRALRTYTSLTVGDGLVSQIPSLMTSIAAGLVTTRASAGGTLAVTLSKQLFGTQRTLNISAGVLAAMALVPGMPHLAFFVLAAGLAMIGQNLKTPAQSAQIIAQKPRTPEVERAEVESSLPLDLLEVEFGLELVSLLDNQKDGSLIQRIAGLRKQLAKDLGLIIPPVHLRDNLRLRPAEYRVLLSGNPIGKGELRLGRLLAIHAGETTGMVSGEEVKEPAFSLPARWIVEGDRQQAEIMGYTVVDPATVTATHLGELLATYAHELLGRRELQQLLDLHGREHGKVIEELIPTQLGYAQIIKVLKNLLKERVSIRDFRSILEALADHGADVKDADKLSELVRQRLAKQLTTQYLADDGQVAAVMLAPPIETTFRRMQTASSTGQLDSAELQQVTQAFEKAATRMSGYRKMPILLTSADIRRTVSMFAVRHVPQLAVLSFRELDPNVAVRTVDVIGKEQTLLTSTQGQYHAV